MPRENRQKRGRRLRTAAEARTRAEVHARAAAAQRELRVADALLQARRRKKALTGAVGDVRLDPTVAVVRELMRLGHADATLRDRVAALYAVFRLHLPELYRPECLPFAWLVGGEPWVRPLEAWRTPSGSFARRRDALLAHLLTRHAPPRFLYGAFDVPEIAVARAPAEEGWAAQVFSAVGRGESLVGLVKAGVLPPLTRRMLHVFLAQKAHLTPIAALRHAQVLGQGGAPALARGLLAGPLGRLHGASPALGEAFWAEVIAWLCRALPAGSERVAAWTEYIAAARREAYAAGGVWSIAGRTPASLDRLARAWELTRRGGELPRSGLLPLVADGWRIAELGSTAELVREGQRMGHCVAMYETLVRIGKVAIFSLSGPAERGVTLEVSLAAARVVQAKTRWNKPCGAGERARIEAWARLNGLEVAACL